MGLFSKISDRIAEEKAAWDESSRAFEENDTVRQRKLEKREQERSSTPQGLPPGDGGAGAIASIIAN